MGLLDFLKKDKKKEEISPVLPREIYEAGVLELKDVIAPSALEITPREMNLGDKIVRTFFVISYPRFLSDSWFSPIINLDKMFDVSIFIHPIDTASVLRKFQKKVAEVQSQINAREKKGLVRDPKLDTAHQDLEQLRNQLQQAQERLFDVGLYISIYGDTKEELDKTEAEIKSILESKLIYVKPALFQQEQGFKSTAPIATDLLGVHSKLNSAPLSSLFPFVSSDLTSDKGILYGINRHNSSLILFDRFSLANYNSVTFATSGSGKSYAIKLEILRSLMFDTDVIVIDPEREYEYMAEATGGRHFNISLSSDHHINPFDLPQPREDEAPSDILRTHIVTLVGLFRIMLGGLSPEEDALVDRAITETYALKDISGESDFSNIEAPLLSDFELVLAGMEGSESLVQRLSKYTKGTWSGFLNQPTNVDINKKFVVFSVRDMENDLKSVAMYIVTNYIWNAIRRNLKKRLLVIDEAWWMMKSEDTASFPYGLATRGRKYYLGLATITQDVDDFLKSPYGVPMLTNSSIQILLKQSPTSIDLVQKTFNLSDEEKYLLLESNLGEGIFFAGLKHVAIKIIASYTEDQIITSDPSQILAIKKSKEAALDLKETESAQEEKTASTSVGQNEPLPEQKKMAPVPTNQTPPVDENRPPIDFKPLSKEQDVVQAEPVVNTPPDILKTPIPEPVEQTPASEGTVPQQPTIPTVTPPTPTTQENPQQPPTQENNLNQNLNTAPAPIQPPQTPIMPTSPTPPIQNTIPINPTAPQTPSAPPSLEEIQKHINEKSGLQNNPEPPLTPNRQA